MIYIRKYWKLISILFFIFYPLSYSFSEAKYPIRTINKIVAYVNNNVITANQVEYGVNQAILRFKQRGLSIPSMSDLRNKVLDQIIIQQIQLDVANRSGIKATDIEVGNSLDNILQSQNITLESFKAKLLTQGMDFDTYMEQLKEEIVLEKLRGRAVDSRVIVSDDEVERVLNSEAYKNNIDYNLSLIMILLPSPVNADIIAQKQKLADMAYQELRSGKSFFDVSVRYSNSTNALDGGELGWKRGSSIPPVITEELKSTPVGLYTRVIQLPAGFFIFKVNDIKKSGMSKLVKQYHVRHILIKVNNNKTDSESLNKIRSIEREINKNNGNQIKHNLAFIKFAEQNSEDASSMHGGDLGWVNLGDTVPQFEKAMVSLPLNKISTPIRTAFGWHLIEVLGVQNVVQTTDYEKSQIRKDLRDNKASLMYSEWLRDIKAMAYVKINDN